MAEVEFHRNNYQEVMVLNVIRKGNIYLNCLGKENEDNMLYFVKLCQDINECHIIVEDHFPVVLL